MLLLINLIALFLLSLHVYAGDTDKVDGNLYRALNSRHLSIFRYAIWDFSLDGIVSEEKDITVFAPTNQAFLNLLRSLGHTEQLSPFNVDAAHILDVLEKKQIDVGKLLEYHIGKGRVNLATLKRGVTVYTFLPTKSFKWDTVARKIRHNDPHRPGARIFRDGDIEADNGFLQMIDNVLIPYPIDTASARTATATGTGTGNVHAKPTLPSELDPNATLEPSAEPFMSEPVPTQSPRRSRSTVQPLCFPASAEVMLKDGSTVRMDQLDVGMHIRTGVHDDSASKVLLFSHRVHTELQSYMRIETELGNAITISPTHYIWSDGRLTTARAVSIGNKLQTVQGRQKVVRISRVMSLGAVAPHTVNGEDLIVDGILASAYTNAVHPRFASLLLAPLRFAARFGWVDDPLGTTLHHGAPRLLSFIPQAPEIL